MSIGPIELLVVAFPAGTSKRDLVPALAELVGSGTISIIDLLFVKKELDGSVLTIELEQADEDAQAFDDLDGEVGSLLTQDDIEAAAADLAPGASAALLVWENVWATRFATAVRAAGGEVKLNLRIPHDVVEAAFARESAS